MINSKLVEVDDKLSDSSFFNFLQCLNVDEALDLRDDPKFDTLWMNEFNKLENESLSVTERLNVDTLREKAFKNSFKVINDSEISARISDDIELIAKNFILGKKDSWAINYLWDCYLKGVFPT